MNLNVLTERAARIISGAAGLRGDTCTLSGCCILVGDLGEPGRGVWRPGIYLHHRSAASVVLFTPNLLIAMLV